MFEFNAEDLKANQRGQLSPRQKEWLKMVARSARSSSWTGTVVIIGFAALGLCMILTLYLQNEDSRVALFSNPMNLLIFPVIVMVILGVIVLALRWHIGMPENSKTLRCYR